MFPVFVSNFHLTHQQRHFVPTTLIFVKSYHHFLLHLFDKIAKLLIASTNIQCDLHPIHTFLLKQVSANIFPILTTIVNLSLSIGTLLNHIKQSLVTSLLRKPYLDKDTLSNYRPIPNLSLIYKIAERIVKSRLNQHPLLTICSAVINLFIPNITILLLQATYLRAAKVNHIGESEARFSRS